MGPEEMAYADHVHQAMPSILNYPELRTDCQSTYHQQQRLLAQITQSSTLYTPARRIVEQPRHMP